MSSGFAGQRSRPWVGTVAGAGAASEPAGDSSVARDDAVAASAMRGAGGGADAPTSASAISFGFAATAVLVSMFLLMAIFEHLIKPGLASSSSSPSSSTRPDGGGGEGRARAVGLPHARLHHHHHRDASPDKLGHPPKVRYLHCHCSPLVLPLRCQCSLLPSRARPLVRSVHVRRAQRK